MCFGVLGVILLVFTSIVNSEKCTTPNNETANCISLYSCTVLVAAIVTQRNSSIEFVRKSNCGGTAADPLVCCGSSYYFNLPEVQDPSTAYASAFGKENLLPDRTYCGFQRADDYPHPEKGPSMDEIPWLAALRYGSGTKIRTLCSGSLISRRYVLTAAHCIHNKYNLTPITVRLGEYHIKNQTDCTTLQGFSECSEPPQDFGIETKILHPEYRIESRDNSIALLRLNISVEYSDYIRPICLPTPSMWSPEIGNILITSGWGTRHYNHSKQTETKKKIFTRLITYAECNKLDTNSQLLTNNYFCTRDLGNSTAFSCRGDDGAPVTFSFKDQWYQQGILVVSMGCDDLPDRHIKVVNYLDWIKKNIVT